ncbi:MAG: carbamate kinase [Candidatus Eisenbacteria sp.]|nr:carbamate kinase [Candidatus Eisenbacteria bacterium]
MGKLAVIAIGGNSLIKDKEHQSVEDQYQAVAKTCSHVAGLIEEGYNLVITHGNGPQVGFILMRSELASGVLHQVPLDSCGADTQGAIGYHIQRALVNEFRKRGIDGRVAAVVTQVVVDRNDPAFGTPSKPIGPFYEKEKAEKYRAQEGWVIVEDAGRGYRRVVASPVPVEIIEEDAIRTLAEAGFVVVAVGGGGIPVIRNEEGDLEGAAAVIDKDLASGLLASNLGAEDLIISTSVESVALNFGTPDEKPLSKMTLDEARRYLSEGHFAPGSMKPKIETAIEFLEKGGARVIITCPEYIVQAVRGERGTTIVR